MQPQMQPQMHLQMQPQMHLQMQPLHTQPNQETNLKKNNINTKAHVVELEDDNKEDNNIYELSTEEMDDINQQLKQI